MIKEFKAFVMRGNVVDLAVGVIIGGAFGKVISSLVSDIFMPVISVLTGGVKFSDLKIVLVEAVGESAEVAIQYGMFIENIIDFLIIALSIFVFIKLLSSMKKKEAEKPAPAPTPDPVVELLSEIRDELRKD
ncbi:MAG: large conductance mechanosensitive channel protein MscL [Firmicutes bacterium HGW-Firmicutes-20]|jgi:large conductance mechanosensitive channel|nr:MAG: large conductance mechanosensitive channel protein MscL [Firmicutes bacterium HGW-Firmicutes-20]PKM87075.1 MAG: large conductance mechanosensitive channel protein MscL [Firmicutes bacterium HGW-Firmicutes-10]